MSLDYELVIEVKHTSFKTQVHVSFRNRTREESFIMTYLDHDNTVARAGVIAPLDVYNIIYL